MKNSYFVIHMDNQLVKHLGQFNQQHILVVGDLMLDVYVDGNVNRISPEAPVPVVHVQSETMKPGGAANVAAGVRALTGMATTIGVTGDDTMRWKLLGLLADRGINHAHVLADPTRPTTQKTKLVAQQQIIRMDTEKTESIGIEHANKLRESLQKTIHQSDAVVISDYAKGTITREIAHTICHECKTHDVPLIVDAKPQSLEWYKGATVITLNTKEASKVLETPLDSVDAIHKATKVLSEQMNAQIVITAGAQGMFFASQKEQSHVPAHAITLADASGAGDTITTVLALTLASGAPLSECVQIAGHAGALSASRAGVVNPTLKELENTMGTEISEYLHENIKVKQKVIGEQIHHIKHIVKLIIDAYMTGNKILIFGNGGSAADAMHWAAELVGRYKLERRGLPAINLTADSSNLTAIGNDYGYDKVFSRQVEALARPGDVLVGISTSGNSPNVIEAIQLGKEMGCKTACLLGKSGGKLKDLCDVSIVVPSDNTPRIQETHITIIHIICEILEKKLVSEGMA